MKDFSQISIALLLLLFTTASYSQVYTQLQKLVTSDRAKNDAFGMSVGISGNYAICSAYLEDEDAAGMSPQSDAGSAYIFEKSNTGKWTQMQKLVASDRKTGDHFGVSVALSGTFAMVGASDKKNATSYKGAVYVFKQNPTGVWVQHQKIVLEEQQKENNFGLRIIMDGTRALISAFTYDAFENGHNAGAIYVYEVGIDGNWIRKQKITQPSSDKSPMLFGGSMTLSGDYAMIKAFSRTNPDQSTHGIVFAYKKNKGGIWEYTQDLQAPEQESSVDFGISVCISGKDAIITGGGKDGQAGAYLYKRDSSDRWNQVGRIVHKQVCSNEHYGCSAAILDGIVLIGAPVSKQSFDAAQAPPGSVYVYSRDEWGNWKKIQQIQAYPVDSSDFFGYHLALSEQLAIISASGSGGIGTDSGPENNAGAAYIFSRSDIQNLPQTIETPTYSLYPNPTYDGKCTLDLKKMYDQLQVTVSNSMQQIVFSNNYQQVKSIPLQLSAAPGLYYVKVRIDGMKEEVLTVIKN